MNENVAYVKQLPKSSCLHRAFKNEFDHARGCITLQIYCIFCYNLSNLPKSIFDIMTGPNLSSDSLLLECCLLYCLNIENLIYQMMYPLLLYHLLFMTPSPVLDQRMKTELLRPFVVVRKKWGRKIIELIEDLLKILKSF